MRDHVFINQMGNLTLITARTEEAEMWLRRNCEAELWQWTGPTLAVDSRLATRILKAMGRKMRTLVKNKTEEAA
jgi:hypothetical protein